MRVLLALLLSTSFAEITLEASEGACEVEGAIACVELAEGETVVRVSAPMGAHYALQDAHGDRVAASTLPVDGFVPIVPGATRILVYAA